MLVYLDAHLPKPGLGREGLGFPTDHGTLPSLRTEAGREESEWGSWREMEGWEEVEILNGIIYKAIKNK